jgi:hypothetical protein
MTGASTKPVPAGSRALTASAVSGPTVDISTRQAVGAMAPATPSGPSATASSAAGSASMVITISASRAASAGVRAARAPSSTSGPVRPAVRFQTIRSWPAARTRPAIGVPIRPSPRKAMVVMNPPFR